MIYGGQTAGNGNRTRMASLEGWNFTIKLCPQTGTNCRALFALPSSFWRRVSRRALNNTGPMFQMVFVKVFRPNRLGIEQQRFIVHPFRFRETAELVVGIPELKREIFIQWRQPSPISKRLKRSSVKPLPLVRF